MFIAFALLCSIGDPEDCYEIANQLEFETEVQCQQWLYTEGLLSLQAHIIDNDLTVEVKGVACRQVELPGEAV